MLGWCTFDMTPGRPGRTSGRHPISRAAPQAGCSRYSRSGARRTRSGFLAGSGNWYFAHVIISVLRVASRDHRRVYRIFLGNRGRQHQVDAEGLAVHALADPPDVGGYVLRRMHRLAEHREAARVDDGHGHVLAVSECDDRVFDAEPVAEFGGSGLRMSVFPEVGIASLTKRI